LKKSAAKNHIKYDFICEWPKKAKRNNRKWLFLPRVRELRSEK
jgi:hypothetical protein